MAFVDNGEKGKPRGGEVAQPLEIASPAALQAAKAAEEQRTIRGQLQAIRTAGIGGSEDRVAVSLGTRGRKKGNIKRQPALQKTSGGAVFTPPVEVATDVETPGLAEEAGLAQVDEPALVGDVAETDSTGLADGIALEEAPEQASAGELPASLPQGEGQQRLEETETASDRSATNGGAAAEAEQPVIDEKMAEAIPVVAVDVGGAIRRSVRDRVARVKQGLREQSTAGDASFGGQGDRAIARPDLTGVNTKSEEQRLREWGGRQKERFDAAIQEASDRLGLAAIEIQTFRDELRAIPGLVRAGIVRKLNAGVEGARVDYRSRTVEDLTQEEREQYQGPLTQSEIDAILERRIQDTYAAAEGGMTDAEAKEKVRERVDLVKAKVGEMVARAKERIDPRDPRFPSKEDVRAHAEEVRAYVSSNQAESALKAGSAWLREVRSASGTRRERNEISGYDVVFRDGSIEPFDPIDGEKLNAAKRMGEIVAELQGIDKARELMDRGLAYTEVTRMGKVVIRNATNNQLILNEMGNPLTLSQAEVMDAGLFDIAFAEEGTGVKLTKKGIEKYEKDEEERKKKEKEEEIRRKAEEEEREQEKDKWREPNPRQQDKLIAALAIPAGERDAKLGGIIHTFKADVDGTVRDKIMRDIRSGAIRPEEIYAIAHEITPRYLSPKLLRLMESTLPVDEYIKAMEDFGIDNEPETGILLMELAGDVGISAGVDNSAKVCYRAAANCRNPQEFNQRALEFIDTSNKLTDEQRDALRGKLDGIGHALYGKQWEYSHQAELLIAEANSETAVEGSVPETGEGGGDAAEAGEESEADMTVEQQTLDRARRFDGRLNALTLGQISRSKRLQNGVTLMLNGETFTAELQRELSGANETERPGIIEQYTRQLNELEAELDRVENSTSGEVPDVAEEVEGLIEAAKPVPLEKMSEEQLKEFADRMSAGVRELIRLRVQLRVNNNEMYLLLEDTIQSSIDILQRARGDAQKALDTVAERDTDDESTEPDEALREEANKIVTKVARAINSMNEGDELNAPEVNSLFQEIANSSESLGAIQQLSLFLELLSAFIKAITSTPGSTE